MKRYLGIFILTVIVGLSGCTSETVQTLKRYAELIPAPYREVFPYLFRSSSILANSACASARCFAPSS